MRVYSTSFSLQKPGNQPDEYEDAFWPARSGEYSGARLRFAVADGASFGFKSGFWAHILAEGYYRCRAPRFGLNVFLESAYRRWDKYRSAYLQEAQNSNRAIPWYTEELMRIGPFSTLLGLTLLGDSDSSCGEWHAVAVGDTCLFRVRQNELLTSFPLDDPNDFGDRPVLIASTPASNCAVSEDLMTTQGEWHSDDHFYLMTDALAAWFLSECQEGRQPWFTLVDLDTEDQKSSFEELVRDLQETGQMRGDDATLIRLDIF